MPRRADPGRQAHVDYKAIESLRAMKQPFSAEEFSRRRYLAFSPAVVDALFSYYNNINLLWKKFEVIANKTTGDRAHEALDKSAQAADSLLAADYGVVVSKSGDAFGGGLVIVRPKPVDPNEKKDEKAAKGKGKDKKDEDTAPIMMVSSRDGGREVERKLYNGQTDFADKSGDYVLLVDKAHSMGTLGVVGEPVRRAARRPGGDAGADGQDDGAQGPAGPGARQDRHPARAQALLSRTSAPAARPQSRGRCARSAAASFVCSGSRARGAIGDRVCCDSGYACASVHEKAAAAIEEYIRPLIEADGGHIELIEATETRVIVRLSGVCAGCPASRSR